MDVAPVWLEGADGRRWPVAAACALGRSTTNDVVIEDSGVSRRHALIHKQDENEFWVIDLGSGNGTFLNDRRVTLATRLSDGDRLMLGGHGFQFRQIASGADRSPEAFSGAQTIINIRSLPCWLLVADIMGSSTLAARLTTTDMAMLVGRWMGACKEIVETSGGTVNKYLGDGYLAFWTDDGGAQPRILGALQRLRALQQAPHGPKFRIVVHLGEIAIGGGGAQGEDSLTGLDVIYVFRMEKLAGSLGHDLLVSEVAGVKLAQALPLVGAGAHPLPGIPGAPPRFLTGVPAGRQG